MLTAKSIRGGSDYIGLGHSPSGGRQDWIRAHTSGGLGSVVMGEILMVTLIVTTLHLRSAIALSMSRALLHLLKSPRRGEKTIFYCPDEKTEA